MNGDPADLSNLRDIALPSAVSWWPPAPGWWLIGAGIVATVLVASIRAYRRYRANAYRREAIRELDALSDRKAVMPLLKRAAMTAYGRGSVAALSGADFLTFLDRTGRTEDFTSGPARLLPALAYSRETTMTPLDFAAAVAAARRWLQIHEAEGR
ncbi:DUF4381 domain-containing protein [Microvirga puerhi]|uniref:DUF4381 domain-containing protein n=1 Tax=Microvirga puerhi TaxID=2876078 RepID=A0ABS7VGT8_9HYPH|nr:DUF4381 domain-containing protein [Microvirga puerhi]MBZ6074718.1 DUF4381 domain-containing protein [Microvirga puerhi]